MSKFWVLILAMFLKFYKIYVLALVLSPLLLAACDFFDITPRPLSSVDGVRECIPEQPGYVLCTCQTNENLTLNDGNVMLEEIQREIDFIISDRSCADGTDCRVLAYGVFACGDPTEFVPYSANSVDENLLREVAGRYSELSTCLFYRFDVFVDCGIWPDQTSACVDGECILVEDPATDL